LFFPLLADADHRSAADAKARDLYAYIELDVEGLHGFEGWGFYEDEYVKEEGKWKIKSWKYRPARLEQWNKNPL